MSQGCIVILFYFIVCEEKWKNILLLFGRKRSKNKRTFVNRNLKGIIILIVHR